ncbi:MAG: hypothetical protein CL910_21190 [Deltaproteobacteria bacterium]|jgi:protein-L-isoaspartate(D-aspartate) O-methyltransferase|nr:hypothetical protein [Deltaproteobacteria bacterium]
MVQHDLASLRRRFAENVAQRASLTSSALVEALATVPREAFLGDGPWKIRDPAAGDGYTETPDADPSPLYAPVLVAIDAERGLNNGEPVSLAGWLDHLGLAPAAHWLHVGCGLGYYTALGAHVVGPTGRVTALEVEPSLAERASANLRPWPQVEVRLAEDDGIPETSFDAIFVNAGATELLPPWLDGLRPGGRLLVPLTVSLPSGPIGVGQMLLVTAGSSPAQAEARFVSPVGIYHCAGARTVPGERRLRAAFGAGGAREVKTLDRSTHPPRASCWLHSDGFCLQRDRA